jgi:hypothetical protein
MGDLVIRRDEGQATIEYILVLSVVVMFAFAVMQGLRRIRLAEKMTAPITKDFAMTYKYGHPKASGPDEGDWKYHPRMPAGGNNFRIFMNPGNSK